MCLGVYKIYKTLESLQTRTGNWRVNGLYNTSLLVSKLRKNKAFKAQTWIYMAINYSHLQNECNFNFAHFLETSFSINSITKKWYCIFFFCKPFFKWSSTLQFMFSFPSASVSASKLVDEPLLIFFEKCLSNFSASCSNIPLTVCSFFYMW